MNHAFKAPSQYERLVAGPCSWLFGTLIKILPWRWLIMDGWPPTGMRGRIAVWAHSNAWHYYERTQGRI